MFKQNKKHRYHTILTKSERNVASTGIFQDTFAASPLNSGYGLHSSSQLHTESNSSSTHGLASMMSKSPRLSQCIVPSSTSSIHDSLSAAFRNRRQYSRAWSEIYARCKSVPFSHDSTDEEAEENNSDSDVDTEENMKKNGVSSVLRTINKPKKLCNLHGREADRSA